MVEIDITDELISAYAIRSIGEELTKLFNEMVDEFVALGISKENAIKHIARELERQAKAQSLAN